MNKITPITIFTGFLGAGKTTLINQIVKQNPSIRFGFIINEFGAEGVDGQLIENTGDEMLELSNGCICCIVRTDLLNAAEKVVNTGKVDYLIIEASGLAQPYPIAETFFMSKDKFKLDGIVCIVDAVNFKLTDETFKIAKEQVETADIIIINKVQDQKSQVVDVIVNYLKEINQYASIIKNSGEIESKFIIDTGKWTDKDVTGEEEHHEHDHEDVDEIVFTTDKVFDIKRLDKWLDAEFPLNAIRAKGFLKVRGYADDELLCLLQVVGAKKEFNKFIPTRDDFDYSHSKIVFIGKDLNKEAIFSSLEKTLI